MKPVTIRVPATTANLGPGFDAFGCALVLYTDVNPIKGDTAGRLTVRTTGEGKGLLFRDGTVQSITWKRTSEKHTLEFYGENGQRADLAVGTSYINILDESDKASWE